MPDPAVLAHREWLGYVQPDGLVVSIPALLEARAIINRNFGPDHARFLDALPVEDGEPVPEISDFPEFARSVLNWDLRDLYGSPGTPVVPDTLEAVLETYNETLRPTYALREYQPQDGSREWILLVQLLPRGIDLDTVTVSEGRQWQASPQARFERMLRQVHVPIGLLVNGTQIRLVYAPEKELSGHVTFNLGDMAKVAGRPIFAALHMLLSSERLYSVAENERLPAILANSRKYQNVVSTQLAGQVLEALYELLRGFQAADDQRQGDLLRQVLAHDPDHVYAGLLTTLLRLVFLLYAEDRGLLSTDPIYTNHYSVTGLYERLRADAGRYPDTMYQRYGAWAQLLALFRLIYSGGRHGGMRIPAREGYLFDPDRYLFLEGRQHREDQPNIPHVSDGVIHKVLEKLLILDGERLSYRTLAVEQIGSVYEAIMGFELQVAAGQSIAIKPVKKHGAPATINLEALLQVAPDKRLKWLADSTDQKLTGAGAEGLKSAANVNDLLAALEKKIAKAVTPNMVPKGAMIFQPSNERRKSGSHYTPSTLTGPIVEAALAPVLKQLGSNPKPEQILKLKVCDPAMGSGAFLVETCRQLGDALSKAWHAHGEVPALPPDEDEQLHAQRIVAQRCLYGVDKNPLAADLAKLSLWLATLAKDHPFTFLDHSLRHGDSLVGLTRKQIAAFHWAPAAQQSFLEDKIRHLVEFVTRQRYEILNARENTAYAQLAQELAVADDRLSLPRMIGDAVIAAFFSADKPKQREEQRQRLLACIQADLKNRGFISFDGEVERAIQALRKEANRIAPFHWELEFPEVFTTDEQKNVTGGFDVIVGNPPFMGGNQISTQFGMPYFAWLALLYEGTGGICDLVAYFFRRSFDILRAPGTQGLIATKTVAEGETRQGGLMWIRQHGGIIYEVTKRRPWPGEAAVIVSVVHIAKEVDTEVIRLNGHSVEQITSYLLPTGGDAQPALLAGQNELFSQGTNPRSPGFLFDDTDPEGSPLQEMSRIQESSPHEARRIFPYIGGEELNQSPRHEHHRYIIYLDDLETEDELLAYSHLAAIVRAKVKPGREQLSDNPNNDKLRRRWWAYHAARTDFYERIRKKSRVLVNTQVSNHLSFVFQPTNRIFALTLNIYDLDSHASFAVLQSRVHEIWARFMGSHMKDDLRYTPSTCFETFPFPQAAVAGFALDETGATYYRYRADLMSRHNEGLTTIYNWFHDPASECGEVPRLRELHDTMDRAVLDAYGWTDIRPKCEFLPEFEDEDDEDEKGRPRKKKYRYRWPDEIRDDVLARLLELNRQRALEEGQLTPEAPQPADNKDAARKKKASKKGDDKGAPLFATQKGDA